jgi:protein-S-isoprenylcysteine O-methyltransferase Ste14
MLRLVLSLISSLQIGARIQDVVERSVRRTVTIVIAIVVLLFALGFGLVAAYQALLLYDFSPLEASGIVAAVLAFLGVLLLLLSPVLAKPKRKEPDLVNAPAEGLAMSKSMQQVGPLTLLALAFAAGLLASRRR